MKKIVLVSSRSSSDLATKIASNLGVDLVDPNLVAFANTEVCCRIDNNVRGADVFVIQTFNPSVNDKLMELLIMIDALKRASASSITAVIPYYPYSRQDRKVGPRTPITAKLVADLITVAGATRIITMDLHAGQIQGFGDIPFDNIYATPVMLKYLEGFSGKDWVCVSPDGGGVERARFYANRLKCDLAMIYKRRIAPNVAKAFCIVGDVEDKDAIIIDDMIDTAGTLIESVKELVASGARDVYALATHPIFSPPAFERIVNTKELKGVVVTDTLGLPSEFVNVEKLTVLSVSEILAKAIFRTFNNDSVSSLFI